jgi:nucleoside-diphosphate-sugar epimerase
MLASMEVWYAIPSANPSRATETLGRWKRMGYRTAVLLDAGADGVPSADLTLRADPYRGYYQSVIALCRAIGKRADIVVTGGDDMYPDPKHSPEELAADFFRVFSDGYGVMQPTGDQFEGTDRICGSPWLGRTWIERAYQGRGPVWPGYTAFYGDEELLNVARAQDVLWQRPDIVQFHDHWSRMGSPKKTDYQDRNEQFIVKDRELFARRKASGWAGAAPLVEFQTDQPVAVTGAGGFIGNHLVKRLKREGCFVRGIDIKFPEFDETVADEFCLADLRDQEQARIALLEVRYVFHLAADMGGIGYISGNRAQILAGNTLIDLNTLDAAARTPAFGLLYASSACVYPTHVQADAGAAALREDDAFPARPEEGYGEEKLYAERACAYYTEDLKLDTEVVRFHNIYGPLGAYTGGKEKSIAALCRKIALAENGGTIEVWGDGEQRRSYCHVDDCVEGILRVMIFGDGKPYNLGTDESVTINQLVEIIAGIAGKTIKVKHGEGPQGVRGRNCDLTRMVQSLRWRPSRDLVEGLASTYQWIAEQVKR